MIQDSTDHITLIIEAEDHGDALISEVKKIVQDLKHIFGKDMRIDFELTDHIPVDASGKFRWLELRLNHKEKI